MLQTAFIIPTLRKRSPLAQETKSLELVLEQRLYWLIVDDGRRFSASSAEALVSMARAHMGGNPLSLGPSDSIRVHGAIADFYPVFEALQPNVEMTMKLEKALMMEPELPIFSHGNKVNGKLWSWFFVQKSSDKGAGRASWQLVPQKFADRSTRALRLKSTSASRVSESSLFLHDSIGLEFCRGRDAAMNWARIRYDVEDATSFAREHLSRPNIGLPLPSLSRIACPYCSEDPYPDWTFQIQVADPVAPEFLGEAMARLLEPCAAHLSAPTSSIRFQGESFYWKPGFGGGLQPRQPSVWQRARNVAS